MTMQLMLHMLGAILSVYVFPPSPASSILSQDSHFTAKVRTRNYQHRKSPIGYVFGKHYLYKAQNTDSWNCYTSHSTHRTLRNALRLLQFTQHTRNVTKCPQTATLQTGPTECYEMPSNCYTSHGTHGKEDIPKSMRPRLQSLCSYNVKTYLLTP